MKRVYDLAKNEKIIRTLSWMAVLVVGGLLVFRMFRLVNKFAVNILFWDQYGFMVPLFRNSNVSTMFLWQHGPHRQGVGLLIERVLVDLSGWNSRADSFFIMALICLVVPIALWLKKKVFGKIDIFDVFIPVIILNKYQYETMIGTPNLSHSGLPLFLIFVYVCGIFIKQPLLRLIWLLAFNFLLVFTGFGIFMGALTTGIFLLEAIQNSLSRNSHALIYPIIGVAGSLGTIAYFFHDYRFSPAVDCFGLNSQNLRLMPQFSALVLAKFFGLEASDNLTLSTVIGLLVLISLVAIFIVNGIRVIRKGLYEDKGSLLILILTGYTLLYSANIALGRVCLGLAAAQASRYMTLLIPGFLGIWLYLTSRKNSKWAIGSILVFGILMTNTFTPFTVNDQSIIRDFYYNGKSSWKACYLEIEDIEACNTRTGFRIYPVTGPGIKEWLDFFKANGFNLYLDQIKK